jgi:sugar O-acyltransferase (sialic acid O-acetyltransferase NeuD family)
MDLVIYGAGGFGKEIACLINHQMSDDFRNKYNFIGFIDDGKPPGTPIKYGDILGDVSFINEYEGALAVVFSIAQPRILHSAIQKITNKNIEYPNVISPGVLFYDPDSVVMGKGNVLINGCRISCDVNTGDFNLFNGFVAIGHDVTIGDCNSFGPSSRISGDVKIGNNNFFGLNSAVLQGIKIGNEIRLGAGSILMKDADLADVLYFGNPARKVID